MGNEVELARIGMWSEAIKILGPAIITGLLGFFTGRLDYKRRLNDINSQQEFSARESLFKFKKERYQNMLESVSTFNNGIGQLCGMLTSAESSSDNQAHLLGAIRALQFLVPTLQDQAHSVMDTFKETKSYAQEKARINDCLEYLAHYEEPKELKEALDIIIKLQQYSFIISKVSGEALEAEMEEIFKKYLA